MSSKSVIGDKTLDPLNSYFLKGDHLFEKLI